MAHRAIMTHSPLINTPPRGVGSPQRVDTLGDAVENLVNRP